MNILYIYTSISNKQYIGVTTRLRRRLYEHKRADTPFGKSLRKYGEESFKVRLFEFKKIDEAYNLEELLVTEREVTSDWSYNQCLGGKCKSLKGLTNPMKKERNRKKRSELMKTDWNPMSDPKARESHKASMATKEYREFHKNLTTERMKDPEALAKAMVGITKANEARAKKVQCDTNIFNSVSEAADFIGITRSSLRGRIRSKSSKFDNFRYID